MAFDGRCQRVCAELQSLTATARSKAKVLADVQRITKRGKGYTPADWRELCSKLFVTCYMASQYSGDETRERAAKLAEQIGSVHTSIFIDSITDALKATFASTSVHAGAHGASMLRTELKPKDSSIVSPMESHGVPRSPTESHGVPRSPTESHGVPRSPTESHGSHWDILSH